jgi:chromate transporter
MLWVTFVPCFFFIFLGAPYVESVRGNARLHAALSSVTAAVVGVIANLSIFLALHTLFSDVRAVSLGALSFSYPLLGSIRLDALAIAVISALVLLRLHAGMAKTLALAATLGVLAHLL